MKTFYTDGHSTIKYRNIIGVVGFLFLVFTAFKCTSDKGVKASSTPPPNLIIVGEDLSQTFKNFTPITIDDLKLICKVVSKSTSGGKIVFIGIGSSNPKGYTTCVLKPACQVDKNRTIGDQLDTKRANAKAQKGNIIAIDDFLLESEAILEKRNQPYTDINGFFEKVHELINAPGFQAYQKWVYINSDGKQSTPTTNKVNCKLLTEVDNLCISGWKNQPDCNPTSKFLGPPDFIQYLKGEILNK